MKLIAQTIAGMEDISINEVEEIIGAKSNKLLDGRIAFEADEQKTKELIYMARSLMKVYELKQDIEFSSLDDLTGKVQDFEIKDPFVVRCTRWGEHDFESLDAEKEIGGVIYENGHKVDLENPETIVVADVIGNRCLLGIDLTPEPLSKRDYRVKAHPKSINACLAYDSVRLSGWTKDELLLDPNCKDGVIVIEAALWASKIPRGYFDRGEHVEELDNKISKEGLNITAADPLLPNVRASEINAKLAEVRKQITFTKFDTEWIDLKFEKGEVDVMITALIGDGKDLFEAAEKILAKDGKIVTITSKKVNINNGNFKAVEERVVRVHKGEHFVTVISRV